LSRLQREIFLVGLLTLLGAFGCWGVAHAQKPVVRAVMFYAKTCGNCIFTLETVLPPIQQKYGSQLEITFYELNEPANYELWIGILEKLRVPYEQYAVPMLFVGDQMLIGADQVAQRLPGLVDKYLAAGGIGLPQLPGLSTPPPTALTPTIVPTRSPATAVPTKPPATPAPTKPSAAAGLTKPSATVAPTIVLMIAPTFVPSHTATRAPTRAPTIAPISKPAPLYVAYFYQTGCQECSRAQLDLQYLQNVYPQVIVEEFNIYDHAALAQWLAKQSGRASFETPAVFVGQDALIGAHEFTPPNLRALVEKHTARGTERVWAKYDPSTAQTDLIARFRSFGVATIALAGLIDGLNPCAFATLIFFVSYLTFSGRRGKAVLVVGAAFTLGVFLAYLAVGFGMYRILDALGGWLTTVGRWMYALTALLCAALAIISFADFLKARRGRVAEMTLKLPTVLRDQVYAVVRTGQRAPIYVLGVFVTGALVSLVELACTGQIYLPTLIFVASLPELRAQAMAYLLLYNLLFIAPLIVVFVLVYFGTTSFQLGEFLQENVARVKFAMVVVFAALTLWLIAALLG
jgi:cytochrome c biogenesis protein CcdA/glutaredoxin